MTGAGTAKPVAATDAKGSAGKDEPVVAGAGRASGPQTVYVQRRSWSWLLLLLIMLALAGGGWWYVQQRLMAQEKQSALRLQEAESRAASLEAQIRQLQDAQQQLQSRGNALETRVAESSAQQEQPTSIWRYRATSRGRSWRWKAPRSS